MAAVAATLAVTWAGVSAQTTAPGESADALRTEPWRVEVLIRPGNFGLIETRTVLNLPIGSGWLEDRLAVRLRSFPEGFQGPVYSSFRDEYPGGREGLGFFGTLRFAPTERLIIDVTFGRFA